MNKLDWKLIAHIQDGNKSEISNLGTDVLNLKNMGQKL